METQRGKEAHALLKAGAVDGLSIGFRVRNKEGASYRDDENIRHLRDIELMEVSIVTFPMNQSARVSAVKERLSNGEIISKRELEVCLRDAGFTRGQAKRVVAAGHTGLSQRDAVDAPDNEALLRAIQQFSNRAF